ncbi:MAG: FtsX-like permease family protein [Bacteroidales bacterium]|nr:FtsX-like permease family protein [Bacteroidales bacterium]
MRSYLKFLSRNKLYTAIEAVGLIVSLAFVVIIACYTWQQFAITKEAPDYERICALTGAGDEYLSAFPGQLSMVHDRIPEFEKGGRISNYGTYATYNGKKIPGFLDISNVDPEIFEFLPQEFISGSAEVLKDRSQVILGENFARKLSPDMDPVGKTIILLKDTCVIGGIVRVSENSILKERDVYRGFLEKDAPSTSPFVTPYDLVLVRFREGADLQALGPVIDTMFHKEFAESYYRVNKPEHSLAVPFKELYFSKRIGDSLKKGNPTLVYVLIAVGILLLASALFNYINLSVALAGKRAKEMAIRSTLGESKRSILWRYVSEAILFVAICLALAMVLAKAMEPTFNKYLAGDIGLKVAFSPWYLAVYSLLAILIGLISGLIPAWMTLKHDPVSIIKGEQRRQTKAVFSKVFIVIQNVITVALISMALVMELQYNHLVNMPIGANVDNLYYLSSGTVGMDALAAKPYVDRIGRAGGYPGKGNVSVSTTVEGKKIDVRLLRCDEAAFEMFGFEVLKDFNLPQKNGLWLTETAANMFSFDEDNPVAPDFVNVVWGEMEIAGIIKDFALKGPSEIAGNQVGMVYVSERINGTDVVLELNRLDRDIRAELREIARQEGLRIEGDEDIGEKVYGYIPELIEKTLEKTRNFISMIELFMLLAALISLLGLVAMSAYYAGMQTKDIAVRKVFGGTIASETRRAVSEYLILVGVAILIGVPVAIFLSERYLRQFYYRIDGYGWVFVVGAVIALVISFLAVLWQTLRAARTNPATELKKE